MFSEGDSNVRKFNTINRRVFILAIAKGIVFTGIVARLFTLQISDNKKYLTLSDKNRLREWRLPPIRGEFKDCDLMCTGCTGTGKSPSTCCFIFRVSSVLGFCLEGRLFASFLLFFFFFFFDPLLPDRASRSISILDIAIL